MPGRRARAQVCDTAAVATAYAALVLGDEYSCALRKDDLVRECWGGDDPAGRVATTKCSDFNFHPGDDLRPSSSNLEACVDCSGAFDGVILATLGVAIAAILTLTLLLVKGTGE